jgi:hypothetical protein
MWSEARMEAASDLISDGIRNADDETLIEILESRGYEITKKSKVKRIKAKIQKWNI